MIIDITGAITQEAFGRIVDSYNELQQEDFIDIYLNSTGGETDFGDAILDIINKNSGVTTLTAYGKICSSAFDIFYKAKCSKRLLDGTIGMAHLSRIEMENLTVTDSRERGEVTFYRKWWAGDKKKRLQFYEELGMETKELSRIKKGENVYFQYNRLLELLNGKS